MLPNTINIAFYDYKNKLNIKSWLIFFFSKTKTKHAPSSQISWSNKKSSLGEIYIIQSEWPLQNTNIKEVLKHLLK